MRISTSMRWLVVALSAAMLLAVAAACSSETIEVPGETVVVKEEVIKTVEVPGETVVKEVIKEVQVPGETVVVEKVVTETVEVPGETVVVEKEVVKTVEVPGETVTVEVVKTVEVPGETVVVEKEVVKTVEVPGETVVKEVVKTVEVPGETVVKEVVKTVEVPGQKYVTDPTTGKTVVAPEYGGTLTYGRANFGEHSDAFYIGAYWAHQSTDLVNERFAEGDWGSDWAWKSSFAPLSAWKGNLAESWETADPQTYIFKIRKGVYWHNKAPMNGRELTAKDVEYSSQRIFGLGKFSGAGPPWVSANVTGEFESITATDDSTVVFKLTKPDVAENLLRLICCHTSFNVIYPPEVIEQHGDYKDWRNVVGTGPFELTDVVQGSSRTYTKYPDYWGFDEKYLENRLPYVDKIIVLHMPEKATRVAALRAGKIDMLGTYGSTAFASIDRVESLQRTNPEIEVWQHQARSDTNFYYVGGRRPSWNDIRVRQAMQMALDLETIVATYYKGFGNATPQGAIANDVPGFGTPFEEWPEEVKKTYRYDPEGAEALLDEAGLTRGADGIRYKTQLAYLDRYDVSYAELVAGYWREIGMEIDIDVIDVAGLRALTPDDTTYRMSYGVGAMRYNPPKSPLSQFYGGNPATNFPFHNWKDPEFDAMFDAAVAATTLEEQQRVSKEANMYIMENHFKVIGPEIPQFQATQPWVKGFNGEVFWQIHSQLARLWIDSELKAAMGR